MSKKGKKCTKEKAAFHQLYNAEWEKLPVFQGWLSAVPDNEFRALCKYCNKEFRAHRTDLRTHAQSRKHQKAADDHWVQEDIRKISETNLKLPEDGDPSHQDTSSVEDDFFSQEEDRVNDDTTYFVDENNVVTAQIPTKSHSLPSKRSSEVVSRVPMVEIPRPSTIVEKEACKQYIISTQVQDTVKGKPVDRLVVFLLAFRNNEWTRFGKGVTEKDGSCKKFIKLQDNEDRIVPGQYKLRYETKMHFTLNLDDTIFPFIEVSFDILDLSDHYQVNLLISPCGYMVFRNS